MTHLQIRIVQDIGLKTVEVIGILFGISELIEVESEG